MSVQKLPEPRPRPVPLQGYRDWSRDLPLHPFEIPKDPESSDIFGLLFQRRTLRIFMPLKSQSLSTLLFYTAKTLEVVSREAGPDWEHRPMPSSGGCNAIQILIVPPLESDFPCGIYDPRAHGCRILSDTSTHRSIRNGRGAPIETGNATQLLFFTDPTRLSAYYENWESLAWRDSGSLLGGICLVATALDLSICPFGPSREAEIRDLTGQSDLVGVGGCAIGERV